MSDTDVKHSIAGYVFQLLLACRELVQLKLNGEALSSGVAIEKGSDVRVSTNQEMCIEAKFYKQSSFTENANPIRHTLYNFFHSFKKNLRGGLTIPEYRFETNVPAHERCKDFFKAWSERTISEPDYPKYVQYVLDCLVYESYDRKGIKDNFAAFKRTVNTGGDQWKEADYVGELIKHLHQNSDQYPLYTDPNDPLSEEEIRDFVNSMEFHFRDTASTKFLHVKELQQEITLMLQSISEGLSVEDCDIIRNLIIDRFCSTSFFEQDDPDPVIEPYVTVQDLDEILNSYRVLQLKFLDGSFFDGFITDLDKLLNDYKDELIDKGHQDHVDELLFFLNDAFEKLSDEMREKGEKQVVKRYVMEMETPAPNVFIDLFASMAEVYLLSTLDLGDIHLQGKDGINNFGFSKHQEYVLQGYPRRLQNNDRLITKFINHMQNQERYLNASGSETVVFDAACSPCQFDKANLSKLIYDCGYVEENEEFIRFYSNFTYRCSTCLRLDSQKECEFVKSIIEEEINDETIVAISPDPV